MASLLGNFISSLMGSSANGNQNGSSAGNSYGASTANGLTSTTPDENPIFSSFRQSILPAISAQYAAAQKPLYGQAQVGQLANQANQNTAQANAATKAQAARSGTLNAGNTAANMNANQQANTAQVTNFENQIPALNQQNAFNQTQSLLGLASNFLGQSPIGSTVASSNTGMSTNTNASTNTSSSNQNKNPSLFGIPL
jgi:hypothetical protein